MMGQSFYQTYTQRVPAYPYDIFPNGNDYKIYAADSDFASVARNFYQINTDANGNSTANSAHNLGAFSDKPITFRNQSGYYIFMH